MYLIKEMPLSERPRERLLEVGAKNMTDHELIAIVLRTGYKDVSVIDLAKKIQYEYGGIKKIMEMSIDELASIKGIGEAKAIILVAAIELGKRALSKFSESKIITSPNDIFELLRHDMGYLKQEVLVAVYLDTKGHLIEKREIFIGGLNQSLVHPREVFKYAAKCSAFQIVLAHNHPSGDPEPSFQDIEMTKRMVEAGNIMQIPILDHLIITKDKSVSILSRMKIKSGR
jgi:DNA repair protein RadC